MKQINLALEDGLYDSVKKSAEFREMAITDFLRSIINNLIVEPQMVHLSTSVAKSETIIVEAHISKVNLYGVIFYFGTLSLNCNDIKKLFKPSESHSSFTMTTGLTSGKNNVNNVKHYCIKPIGIESNTELGKVKISFVSVSALDISEVAATVFGNENQLPIKNL